jgi:hypothetical protein
MKRGRDDMDLSDTEDTVGTEMDWNAQEASEAELYGTGRKDATETSDRNIQPRLAAMSLQNADTKNILSHLGEIESDVPTMHKFCAMYKADDIFLKITSRIYLAVFRQLLPMINLKNPKVFCRLMTLSASRLDLFSITEEFYMGPLEGYNLEAFYLECFYESCFPEGSLDVFNYLMSKVYPPDRFELAMRICLENLEHGKAMTIKQDHRYNSSWPLLNPHRGQFSPVGEQILMS